MPEPWLAQQGPPEVTPINDLREHLPGVACWCKPRIDDGVIVHNSMDGRERYENLKVVPS